MAQTLLDDTALLEAIGGSLVSQASEGDDLLLEVRPDAMTEVASLVKRAGYDYFCYVTAVDRGDDFELVYRFSRTKPTRDVVVKVFAPRGDPVVGSMTSSFKGALWQEREVYDLFGIQFNGHPNCSRILMPDDWVGHPLRKDYEDERIEKRPRLY